MLFVQEKEKLAVRVRNLEDKNSETAAEMKILVLNKDRFIQEKLELHQEIQNLHFEKETFEKVIQMMKIIFLPEFSS